MFGAPTYIIFIVFEPHLVEDSRLRDVKTLKAMIAEGIRTAIENKENLRRQDVFGVLNSIKYCFNWALVL